MYPIRKDMPFYVSLRILGIMRYYPLNSPSKTQFFIILTIWTLIWNGLLMASYAMLLIDSMKDQDYSLTSLAIMILCGLSCLASTSVIFAIKHQLWSYLFLRVVDDTEFGRTPNFEQIKKETDNIGYACLMLAVCPLTFIALFEYFFEPTCLANGGTINTCGLLAPSWIPRGLKNPMPYKRFYMVYQVVSVMVLCCFLFATSLQFQVCRFIDDKVEHLRIFFVAVGSIEDKVHQKDAFFVCIEYHQYILRLCEQLNSTCKQTFGHMTVLSSMVLAFLIYQAFEQGFTFFYYSFLFIQIILFMCHTGQELENSMSKVGEYLYLSDWYNFSLEIRKLVPMIIQRSQRPVGLEAWPKGSLNYSLFVAVMKATYSCLNLLLNGRR